MFRNLILIAGKGLRFLQAYLSHERYLDEARARVEELEREVEMLRAQRSVATTSTVAEGTSAEEKPKSRGWLW